MYIYICVCVCVCVFVRLSPQDFHLIPGGFCYIPGEKFTAKSRPRDVFEICSF